MKELFEISEDFEMDKDMERLLEEMPALACINPTTSYGEDTKTDYLGRPKPDSEIKIELIVKEMGSLEIDLGKKIMNTTYYIAKLKEEAERINKERLTATWALDDKEHLISLIEKYILGEMLGYRK